MSFPLLMAWNGCASVGESGIVWSRTSVAPNGLVIESYTVGCGVSPHTETGGVIFGWRHVAYIYPGKDEPDRTRVAGWRWFYTPLPGELPLSVASNSVGASLDTNAGHVGFNFGLHSRFASRVRVDRPQVVRLHYRPFRPEETVAQLEEPNKE
jgi:hypothetical protein